MKLKIVSFNIRRRDDRNGNSILRRSIRLKKVLENYSPDLIGFQEYSFKWKLFIPFYFGRKYRLYSVPRSTKGKFESVPILWNKDRFDCIKKGCFWLSDTPSVESGGWDEKYNVNRICLYVILQEKTTGKKFTLINTHFGFGDECQVKSAELLIEYSSKISDHPTIITGDFNMTRESAGYSAINTRLKDVNVLTVNDTRDTYHGYSPDKDRNSHIDYILVNEKVFPKDYKIIDDSVKGKYPSDHYGIYAEAEI